jgi:hypothetical protein
MWRSLPPGQAVTIEQSVSCITRATREKLGREICLVTAEEKRAMKAACVQAAATLIAARDSGKVGIDVEECITLAALLYVRVVTIDWREAA